MGPEQSRVTDDVGTAMARGRGLSSSLEIYANVEVTLYGEDGRVKHHETGHNLVTDAGDEHIIRRLVQGNTETAVQGMKLGTGTTTAAKSGAGGHVVTYVSGSYEALDATPTMSDKGGGSGYRAAHICTWAAGDVTNANLNEVILTQDATDAAGSSADTVARYVFGSTIDKQSGDSLEVTWNVDVLGA